MTAARQGHLAAVPPGVTRAPKKKLDVAAAAARGSHRDLLIAMRDRIAKAVANEDCPPRDLAALTRRLQDIAKEIESIDLRSKQESDEDAIAPDAEWDEEAL
jgi:hypothetical protein